MTGRWTLPPFALGDMAPRFAGVSRSNPKFHFSTSAGRYLLLAFMPRDPAQRDAAVTAFAPLLPAFDGRFAAAFFVAREADSPAIPADSLPAFRWFFDPGDQIAPLFHLADGEAAWLLFDPAMRLIDRAPITEPEPLFARVRAGLPPLNAYAGSPMVAPVLIVPRVLTPDLCRRLIDHYEAAGGTPSGVMRDIDGRTVGILDPMKRRNDVNFESHAELNTAVVQSINRSVVPMMARTFQFRPTRIERHLIACYDAAEGGYFQPHRDDESLGTRHRRFACSINLNAEEFEGGDLRFPEFGPRTYRPPTGGAVIFACNLQHEATPVTRGRRFAVLPFFYDEEGARIREQNLAFLQTGG